MGGTYLIVNQSNYPKMEGGNHSYPRSECTRESGGKKKEVPEKKGTNESKVAKNVCSQGQPDPLWRGSYNEKRKKETSGNTTQPNPVNQQRTNIAFWKKVFWENTQPSPLQEERGGVGDPLAKKKKKGRH